MFRAAWTTEILPFMAATAVTGSLLGVAVMSATADREGSGGGESVPGEELPVERYPEPVRSGVEPDIVRVEAACVEEIERAGLPNDPVAPVGVHSTAEVVEFVWEHTGFTCWVDPAGDLWLTGVSG